MPWIIEKTQQQQLVKKRVIVFELKYCLINKTKKNMFNFGSQFEIKLNELLLAVDTVSEIYLILEKK